MPDPNLIAYALTATATGEVRDADGNLLSSKPITSTTTVHLTAEQVRAIEGARP